MDELWPLKVWANNTAWQSQVEWALNSLKACRASSPIDDKSPCNRFVGQALEKVYNIIDFKNGSDYLSANQIVSYLVSHCPPWKSLGRASSQESLHEAQGSANSRIPVVAVRPDQPNGHVAIVLPGKLIVSANWGLNVPNSASFFYQHPEKSYVGQGLSHAFRPELRFDVELYSRPV